MTTNLYSQRNPAIDTLRALTMTLMIFVNDLWTVKGYPSWMAHATINQDFLGLSDIVFPCFLFVVGMSIPYALENAFAKGRTGVEVAGHILTRSLALILMGVFLVNTEGGLSAEVGINRNVFKLLLVAAFFLIWNKYPTGSKIKWLRILGVGLLIFLGIIFMDRAGNYLRPKWWGILGLIGWSYLLCAFVYYFSRDRLKYLIPIWAIFLVWSMLKCKLSSTGVPILNLPEGNALDAITGIVHLDNGAHQALVMGGIILSVAQNKLRQLNMSKRNQLLTAAGGTLFFVLLGIATNQFWIISKLQATAPWVLYSSAIAVGVYAVISWLYSVSKINWFKAISPAGSATLTCYMVPHIIYALLNLTGIGTTRPEWLASGFLGLLSCLAFSFLCIGFTWLFTRLKIKLIV